MRQFKILSIDGGGMKGMFSAAFLASVEKELQKKVVDYFDLIVGTSTGGIIAISLGLGMSAQETLNFYINEGKHIFPNYSRAKKMIKTVKSFFRPKYDVAVLERTLKKHFGDRCLGESKTRLVIPTFNASTADLYLYKTAHHQRLMADYKVPVWEIAKATSAAPSFFRSHRIGYWTELVDGGLWANNPSMVAIAEAIGFLERTPEEIALLSVGTSLSKVSIGQATLESGGLIRWSFTILKHLYMHLQVLTADRQAQHILKNGRYLRVDPSTSNLNVALDDFKKASSLVPFGEHVARHNLRTLEHVFFSHKAVPFQPIHAK